MKVTANFDTITGQIKPMHGVNQAPIYAGYGYFHYLKEAGIPYSRQHDVGGAYGGNVYVDIPNLFRDFDADENDPASYDFAFTDELFQALKENGCEIFFRLGVTIEGKHTIRAYRIFPPADYEKWARICEHVVRHYNEGWADGFHFGIRYWEIWNEPDCCSSYEQSNLWRGTPEQYYHLYEVTAKHLKKCFGDTIKVGGYGAIGLYDYAKDPTATGIGHEPTCQREFLINFLHGFFQYITSEEHKAPIDFFTWHSYEKFSFVVPQARYIRRVLEHYGLSEVEDILDEWSLAFKIFNRNTPFAAASTLSVMLALQKEKTSLLCYYDARIGSSQYGGMFNPDTHKPYPNYYAFMMFNRLYRLKNEVETTSDDERVWVGAATDGKKKVLLLTNLSDQPAQIEIDVTGADPANAEILMLDDTYQYSPTGKTVENGILSMAPYGCAELRFE